MSTTHLALAVLAIPVGVTIFVAWRKIRIHLDSQKARKRQAVLDEVYQEMKWDKAAKGGDYSATP